MMSASGSAEMSQQDRLVELLQDASIIPVITIERVDDAVPLTKALVAGGLRLLEVTLRTPVAPAAAAAIVASVPEAIVGIGTVVSERDLVLACQLGARFALSPGATLDLLDAAAASNLPFIPGIATASELMTALARGFDIVKFLPAVPAGGIATLKALAGPFPQVRFCPTGGIDETNTSEWLAQPNVVAVGGSWLAPATDVRNGDWPAITKRVQRTLTKISRIHKGLNQVPR